MKDTDGESKRYLLFLEEFFLKAINGLLLNGLLIDRQIINIKSYSYKVQSKSIIKMICKEVKYIIFNDFLLIVTYDILKEFRCLKNMTLI